MMDVLRGIYATDNRVGQGRWVAIGRWRSTCFGAEGRSITSTSRDVALTAADDG